MTINILDKITSEYDYCFSIGKTRISGEKWECRVFPRGQDDDRKVITATGNDMEAAINAAIVRLKDVDKIATKRPAWRIKK